MPEINTRGTVAIVAQKISRLRRKRWPARVQSLVLIAACSAVVASGIALFSLYAVSPAQGIISAVRDSFGGQAGFDMTPRTVSGSYASFEYPRGLTAMQMRADTGTELAAYNWKHQDIQTWRLAISIVDVPSQQITNNNAYVFRKLHPQRFTESSEMVNGAAVPIMTDNTAEGFSEVGFLQHGRYQAVVSLYGDDQQGAGPLQATLAMVLRSWRWQQS